MVKIVKHYKSRGFGAWFENICKKTEDRKQLKQRNKKHYQKCDDCRIKFSFIAEDVKDNCDIDPSSRVFYSIKCPTCNNSWKRYDLFYYR